MKNNYPQPVSYLLVFLFFVLVIILTAPQGLEAAIGQPVVDISVPEEGAQVENPLYLNLLWHQHQPLYYKDDTGTYTRPWVRAHATKDYYDMASTLAKYPDVKATFNLTPVLIRQLDDFNAGAKDIYWVLAEKPAGELTEQEKTFLLNRFFDANWDNMIRIYPGYKALLDKRGGVDEEAINKALETFTEGDFRDLQIWFNLVWIDPDFLRVVPLKSLVEKDHDFSESDKEILFAEVSRIISEVLPIHREMQENGQIEIITTPYAHPILPLIYDTDLALAGNPEGKMPADRFSYPNDAIAQLERSVEYYQEHFGQMPTGLWPSEGAVAEEVIPMISNAGYLWMATGEPVLAASLGIGSFTRDLKETVQEADILYRPYYVEGARGGPVAIFFRDWTLSDKVGFTYSGMPGENAAQDLINRLENIRQQLDADSTEGPHIVSIVLDGENAWEYYDNDGKDFLNSLYQLLSESKTLITITPTAYLELYPDQQTLETLAPGAWFSPNFDTWIGESEEKLAWEYLRQTRYDLSKYDITHQRDASPEAISTALDYMYLAEGSDWFWWYGADQDSGQDSYFDEGFRALLGKVYESLGEPLPAFVNVPIVPLQPADAEQAVQGFSSPVINGVAAEDEWSQAAVFTSGSMGGQGFFYAYDTKNLYLRVSSPQPFSNQTRFGFYIASPRSDKNYPFALDDLTLLGIAATHLVEFDGGQLVVFNPTSNGWSAASTTGEGVLGSDIFEASVPWSAFGDLEPGDDLRLVVVEEPAGNTMPAGGPAQIVMPDFGSSTTIMEILDPEGDDFGPGTYSYPTDVVFENQAYDLKAFTVSHDEKRMIFKFEFYGPVPNPWGSPNNLSIQSLDVYIDTDPGRGTGARLFLPGRNAALESGNGWDIALWAEGWTPQVLVPDPQTLEPKTLNNVDFKIIVDPAASLVTLRVPLEVFGEGDPETWGYAAAVMGQEGYPTTGVWRVRDVNQTKEQWRFGGAPNDVNHTRIIDLAFDKDQAKILGSYPGSSGPIQDLDADDYCQIPLLIP